MGHFETPKQFFRSLDADVAGALIAAAVDEFAISVSLFQQVSATHLRLRLSALGLALQEPVASGRQMLLKVMENAPDAFVVTDLDDRISTVNYAFLDLVQLASEEMVRNETLEKWLDRTGVDLNLLISKLGQGGAARLFATTMRGEYGSTADVQISAVAVNSGEQPCLAACRTLGWAGAVASRGARLGAGDAVCRSTVPKISSPSFPQLPVNFQIAWCPTSR